MAIAYIWNMDTDHAINPISQWNVFSRRMCLFLDVWVTVQIERLRNSIDLCQAAITWCYFLIHVWHLRILLKRSLKVYVICSCLWLVIGILMYCALQWSSWSPNVVNSWLVSILQITYIFAESFNKLSTGFQSFNQLSSFNVAVCLKHISKK